MATSDFWSSKDLKDVNAGGLINEDVMQKIWNISRIPLPFMDIAGVGAPADNSYTEWVTDEQASVDTSNAVVDGADVSDSDNKAANNGLRQGNHCQQSTKYVVVTDRAVNSNTVGRANELAYQVMMRQQDLMRDLEAISTTTQASVADNGDSTAGKVGGFAAWLKENALRGTGGSDGGFNTSTKVVDAPTAGQSRALLTDTHLKELIEDVYLANGNPTTMMSVPQIIRRLNDFAIANPTSIGMATPTANVTGSGQGTDQTAQMNIAFYRTDFGFTLKAVPNRLQQTYSSGDSSSVSVANLFLIDPSMVEFAYLQAPRTNFIGRTGTAEKRQIVVDWTLRVKNEKAHGVISDLNPTGSVAAS